MSSIARSAWTLDVDEVVATGYQERPAGPYALALARLSQPATLDP
ncbi:MAG: hypothetical protein U5Q44_02340 [Dehalococcoidia bacterium]|nr:hypothetical protein [Dehalococcoidia bacterium]